MNDLSTLTAQPKTLKIGDREYLIYPLTVDDFGAIQAWVDRQFPDPVDQAYRDIEQGRPTFDAKKKTWSHEPFTVAQQQFMIKTAQELKARSRRLLGTDEANTLVRSMNGVLELMRLSIAKGDPTFTEEKARTMYGSLRFGDIERVFDATQADMVVGSPKGEAGGIETASTTPTSGTTTPVS